MPDVLPLSTDTKRLPVRYFYLSSDLQRATMWGIGGCILGAGLVFVLPNARPDRGKVEPGIVASLFLGGAAFLSQYLLCRVRLDDAGIRTRFLWWWNTWAWEAFASGDIQGTASVLIYEDPARPWWRRKLNLGYLEEANRLAINELVKRVWTRPETGPVPESVEFNLGWPLRLFVELNSVGVEVRSKEGTTMCWWSEIEEIEIWRLEPDREDFRELRIKMEGHEITLKQTSNDGDPIRNWQGATSEFIAAKICREADPAVVQDFAEDGLPRSLAELDGRGLREAAGEEEALRVGVWAFRAIWILTACFPLFLPWPRSLIMLGFTGVFFGTSGYLMQKIAKRDIAERREKRRRERAEFLSR